MVVEIGRFVDLVFGKPFETPTADELGMYFARAAALRSADLSRQVGAVIMRNPGEIIAIGYNDVPSHWEDTIGLVMPMTPVISCWDTILARRSK